MDVVRWRCHEFETGEDNGPDQGKHDANYAYDKSDRCFTDSTADCLTESNHNGDGNQPYYDSKDIN